MQCNLAAKRDELKGALMKLGQRLDSGDESELFVWVMQSRLACAHRPLRYHHVYGRNNKGRFLPSEASAAVRAWVQTIRDAHIQSLICLLSVNELKHYAQLQLGSDNLIEFYRKAGLIVEHLPWEDPAHRPHLDQKTYAQELARIRTQANCVFESLPKPILMHCSAGIDRTSPVAAYIFCERNNEPNTKP